jgi:hypothetical protein
MTRGDWETKLIESEAFRDMLAALRDAAADIEKKERILADGRASLHKLIRELVIKHGVPKAFLARQVGLSPQRINSILHEQEAKTSRKGKGAR